MSHPLVSCIVLSYNKFNYIYSAIKSVLEQDYPKIELIISDDCSENFPEKEILQYIRENKRENIIDVKILKNILNVGTVKNYNGAIKEGQGDYFINLSGDDVFFDNQTISKIVEKFEVSGIDVIICSRYLYDEELKNPIKLMPTEYSLKYVKKIDTAYKQYKSFLLGKFFDMASGSALYFTKKHIEEWGYFDETYRLWEDGPFFVQYTKKGNFINYAFNIISIKYRSGGVSGEKKIHPMLLKDSQVFIEKEMNQNFTDFSLIEQQIINIRKYKTANIEKNSKFGLYMCLIKNIFGTFSLFSYACLNFLINKINIKRNENE